jgi:hypothetical protein
LGGGKIVNNEKEADIVIIASFETRKFWGTKQIFNLQTLRDFIHQPSFVKHLPGE